MPDPASRPAAPIASIVTVGRRPYWVWADGTCFPVVSGGADDPPPDSGAAGNPPQERPPDAGKAFTQADVDRIVKDRLAREREKYADYDDVKAKATRLDEIEAASRSDLEKAQAAAAAAEQEKTAALERVNMIARRAAVVAAAAKAGAVDPDAVVALLPADTVSVADDGTVSGAEDAVGALLEQKPYLRASTTPPAGSADGGTRPSAPGQLTREELKGMTPEQIVEAKQQGRLKQILGVT